MSTKNSSKQERTSSSDGRTSGGDTFLLPIRIPSRNVLDKTHWAAKSKTQKEYALLIRNQMRLRKFEKLEDGEFRTLYILSLRKRLLDEDNLVGGCKHLIDALVEEAFIFDDSPKFVKLKIKQQKTTQEEITVICRR